MTLRVAALADAPAIQALFDEDPDFFILTEGAPPRPDEAAQMFAGAELPPGVGPDGLRHFFDGTVLLDLLVGWPTPTTWCLGLIFIAKSARGRGLGSAAIRELAAHAAAHGGTVIRLAVVVGHACARQLYDRLGFIAVGRKTRTTWCGTDVEVDVMELPVSRTGA